MIQAIGFICGSSGDEGKKGLITLTILVNVNRLFPLSTISFVRVKLFQPSLIFSSKADLIEAPFRGSLLGLAPAVNFINILRL